MAFTGTLLSQHVSVNSARLSCVFASFVRRERMDSIGEFVVVILHSLAHIKTGDLTDDSDTVFLREFYKVRSLNWTNLYNY